MMNSINHLTDEEYNRQYRFIRSIDLHTAFCLWPNVEELKQAHKNGQVFCALFHNKITNNRELHLQTRSKGNTSYLFDTFYVYVVPSLIKAE